MVILFDCFDRFFILLNRFLGHSFVDMLDGRFECLTCSKHVVGIYKGKEHAPHVENSYGVVTAVECDQAGRIPLCDKCTRPVNSDEDAFKHETRFYHLECASCNRCRKKLFKVPCRKLGSALGQSVINRFLRFIFKENIYFRSSLSRMLIKSRKEKKMKIQTLALLVTPAYLLYFDLFFYYLPLDRSFLPSINKIIGTSLFI